MKKKLEAKGKIWKKEPFWARPSERKLSKTGLGYTVKLLVSMLSSHKGIYNARCLGEMLRLINQFFS
jgi:hypothetical protein